MRNSILSRLRENPKIVKVLVFLTSWTQLHAYANTAYLNKPKETLPGADFHYSSVIRNDNSFLKNDEKSSAIDSALGNNISYPNEKNIDSENISGQSIYGHEALVDDQKNIVDKSISGFYLSDIKEGIIGKDSEHPIDQVYDNIFNITVNEKIRPDKQYSLEYDLYGLKDYKQVSKVINDELAVGGQNVEKTTVWIHQTEPVKATAVKEGKNIIIFTIPNSSDYSYKIRNLRIVASNKKSVPSEFANSYFGQTNSKYINSQNQTEELSLHSATLKIEGNSVKNTAVYSITALRDIDMPALTQEMVNVTADHFGYRFLPHGENFSAPAKVSLGYDKSKIPAGYNEQDIKTFYFDLTQKKWIALEKAEKDSLQKGSNIIVSKTTHFTDMVNGIIKVPESPETGSYAPNSIKDIKAADPTEGIVSIAPPAANNMGTVNTGFPIKLPAGRGGMQPSLSVNYSSEGGNGWLGLGWDLSIPSISIDTRWGVPTYDQNKESEIYTLGGEQLTFKVGDSYVLPNRAEGFEKGRETDRQFYPRIEGGYSKIIRKGNNPNNYVWIVTSKDGTRSCFGGDENGNVFENAVLRQPGTNNIGHWALYKTIDTNGNFVEYTYNRPPNYNSAENVMGKGGQEMYIGKIEYTKYNAQNALKTYTVNFDYYDQRPDVQVDGRLGFVQVTSKKLKSIAILYGTDKVRSYEFGYKEGAFKKSLLETITEKDANDQIFYTNRVEYQSAPNELFGAPQIWNVNNVNGVESGYFTDSFSPPAAGETFGGKYNAINSNISDSKNSGFRLGFWTYTQATTLIQLPSPLALFIPLVITETGRYSIGAQGGFGNSNSRTQVNLLDMDGDNLPDITYKVGGDYYYAKNKNGSFDLDTVNKINIPGLGHTKSRNWNAGIDGNYAVGTDLSTGLGFDYSNSTTDNKIYFEDFNADGLVDVSDNGKVKFGYNPNANLTTSNTFTPKFDYSSQPSPAPIQVLSSSISTVTPSFNSNEKKMMLEQNPLHDMIKVWVAPKSGNITVTSNCNLLPASYDPNEDNTSVDGVAISIQKGNNPPDYTLSIPKDDTSVKNTVLSYNNINKGDKIYFRVSSKYDGRYDQVNWNPVIQYTSNTSPAIDGNNRDLNTYNFSDDFIVSGSSNFSAPEAGTLNLSVNKPGTSDYVKISVLKNNTEVWSTTYAPTDNVASNVSVPVSFAANDDIIVKLLSNTNIHWPDVEINPVFTTVSGKINYLFTEYGMFNYQESAVNNAFTYFVSPSDAGKTFTIKPVNITNSLNGSFTVSAKIKNRAVGKFSYTLNNGTLSAIGSTYGYALNKFTSPDINENLYIEITTQENRTINQAFLDYLKNINLELVVNEVPASGQTNSIVGGTVTLTSGQAMILNFVNSGPPSLSGYPSGSFRYRVLGNPVWTGPVVLQSSASQNILSQTLNLSPGIYEYEASINFNGQASYYGSNSYVSVSKAKNKTFVYSPLTARNITQILSAEDYDTRFGQLYRGWGSFIINGNNPSNNTIVQNHLSNINSDFANNGSVAEMKIDETKLLIPQSSTNPSNNAPLNPTIDPATGLPTPYNPDSSAMSNQYFVMTTPIINKQGVKYWMGLDENNYITKQTVSTSRLGDDNIDETFSNQSPVFSFNSYQMPSLIQKSKLYSVSGKAGISYSGSELSGDGNYSSTIFAENKSVTAMADMNADGFPDHIVDSNLQYTNANGFLSSKNSNIGSYSISRTEQAIGVGAGTSFTHGTAAFTLYRNSHFPTPFALSQKNDFSASLNGNFGFEKEKIKKTYFDINGDGIPDRIENGNVELGLGYGFYPANSSLSFNTSYSRNENWGAGLGVSLFNGSVQGGTSLSGSTNDIEEEMFDLNGDGLQDYINLKASKYFLNLGNKFEDYQNLSVGKARSTTGSLGANFGLSIPISIPIIVDYSTNVLAGIKIVPGININSGNSVSKTKSTFKDMNGDGYLDYITSDDTNSITVRLNQIGTTNLLRKVTTPSGGSWEVDYERVGNTYDMPQSKYVLKTVITNDGFTGDSTFSPDVSKITVKYENPYHSRRERTFYGFEKVTVNQIDTKQGGVSSNVIYRKTEQTFNNKNYYLKGALLNEKLLDASGKIWTEKNNTYELRKIHSPNTLNTLLNQEKESEKNHQDYACFIALKNTVSKFYEGLATATKSTSSSITEYDNWGNAVKVTDFGDTQIGSTEIVSSEVTYGEVASGKYVIAPKTVKNTATGIVREKRAEYNPLTGDLTKIIIKNQGADYSVYDFEYDVYGNITKSTGPANSANQRFFHQYTYDDNVKIYPVKVQDAFGYTSKTQYDFRFGLPVLTVDMNLQPMKFAYDAKARTTEITGPYEMFNNIPWTIKFEYNPVTDAPLNATNAQSYAITKHYDPEYTDSTINTITIADGFGEAIQVKKTGDIHNDGVKYIVAGKVETDAFGRALKTYYPTTENIGTGNTLYNASVDTIEPTINQYDVLDRVVYTKLPGENLFSTIEYGFANDVQGRPMFATTFKDELGSIKKSYTDIKGRTTSVWEVSNTGDIKTKFTHDAIGQILQVEDVAGNITTSQYDDLGRRVSYKHPDSGITTYKYDPAGNMYSKTNAANEVVEYKYDYTRLKEVSYPVYPENNVKYYYGAAMDASAMDNNAVGRLWYQTDATGTQYLKYGKLGELTYQRRSVAVPDAGVYWFGTSWEYDTWNRVKKITYPDGEEVFYNYNRAGNLFSMVSNKDGFDKEIIHSLGYDKFEQRVYLQYGNGTETTYEYETNRRRLLKMYAKNSNRYFMQNTYQYDVVSNVMQVHNNAPVVQGLLGGGTNYAYGYDDLYRLTSSSGNWRGINSEGKEERHRFTVGMTYDNMHNIMSKTQKHEWVTGSTSNNWTALEPTSYRLNYKYEDPSHPHAPSRIIDEPNLVPNATCCNPDDPGVKFQDYQYDPKGNPTQILQQTCTNQEEKAVYLWDEENRLRFVDTNPTTPEADGAAIYTYDAGGERIIKDVLFKGKLMRYDGNQIDASGETIHEASIYPSGLITLNLTYDLQSGMLQEPRYTKHYYAGSQRIQSKIGNSGSIGAFDCAWLIIPFGGTTPPINPVNVSNQILQTATQSNLVIMQTNNLTPPVNYGQNGGYTGNCVSSYASNVKEEEIYWFHPDHLGSSSFITGLDGEVTQNIEYFPSGEIFVENHNKDGLNSQYKFNGKEQDAETGYYYYGARYYNPRVSLWLNVDPLAEKFAGRSPYEYTFSNPIKLIDPDGKEPSPYSFNKTDFYNYIRYIGDNARKTKRTVNGVSAYGYSDLDKHDCVTTVNRSMRILLRDNSIPAVKNMDDQMNKLISMGYAGGKITIDFKDSTGNMTTGKTNPVGYLNKSLTESIKESIGKESGYFLFGMSIMDGYHSVTIAVKSNGNPEYLEYQIYDQHGSKVSINDIQGYFGTFNEKEVDNWLLKYVSEGNRTQSGEKGRTTTTITPIKRKHEYENEKKGSYLTKFKKIK